jgi:hypothetical protein
MRGKGAGGGRKGRTRRKGGATETTESTKTTERAGTAGTTERAETAGRSEGARWRAGALPRHPGGIFRLAEGGWRGGRGYLAEREFLLGEVLLAGGVRTTYQTIRT